MLKNKRIILFSFFVIIIFLFGGCNSKTTKHIIENGSVNLTQVDFINESVSLTGTTMFKWGEFLLAENDSVSLTDVIRIDNSWNNQPAGHISYPMHGYATYGFKIEIPDEYIGQHLMLRPHHFISYASEIYVNEKKVSGNGTVGKSKNSKEYSPSRKTSTMVFDVDTNVLDIKILVANFNHFRGGVFESIEFGLASNLIDNRDNAITYNLFVIISLLIMFLYHLLFFFVFKQNKTTFFFALTCLFFAVDLSLQGPMCFFLFFPSCPFSVHSFLHLAIPFLLPSSFMFFFHSVFPDIVSKKIRNISGFISVLLIGSLLFNNSELNSYISKPHYYYIGLLLIYTYYAAIKAVVKKRESAILFLVAYIIFSMCAINDLLKMFEVLNTVNLISAGMVMFIFLLSIMQAYSSLKMHNKILGLSKNLKLLNVNLEKRVSSKTKKLNLLLEEEKRLKLFQQDMTNMIIHDLKGGLNSVINVKQIAKYDPSLNSVEQVGYQMNNLVMNLLDVYKYNESRIQLNLSETNLVDIIKATFIQVEFIAKQKNISIFIVHNIECIVSIDIDIISRVIGNLLSNAVKYSPTNDVIKIELKKHSKDEIKISIFNHGPHIPFEQQDVIFERFKHSETAEESTIESTGLGLTFCKLAVGGHGGTIGVDSSQENGVCFWFILPNLILYKKKEEEKLRSESSHILDTGDKIYLFKFVTQLSELEVFDVSAIRIIIAKIQKENERIENWVNELLLSVHQINEVQYRKLLEIIKNT